MKGAFYGLMTAAAVIVVLTSLLLRSQLPAFLARYGRTMRRAVDVQGGLRFVYEVDVEKVISTKVQLMAPLVERRMREDLAAPKLTSRPMFRTVRPSNRSPGWPPQEIRFFAHQRLCYRPNQ